MERILKQIKILRSSANKLRSISTIPLQWFYSNLVIEVVLNATAKSSFFNVQVIKNKNNNSKKNFKYSIPVVEDGAKRERGRSINDERRMKDTLHHMLRYFTNI